MSASENPEDVTKPWLIGEAMRAYARRSSCRGQELPGVVREADRHPRGAEEMRVIRSIEDLTDEELSAIIVSDRSGGGTDECPPQTAASVQ